MLRGLKVGVQIFLCVFFFTVRTCCPDIFQILSEITSVVFILRNMFILGVQKKTVDVILLVSIGRNYNKFLNVT